MIMHYIRILIPECHEQCQCHMKKNLALFTDLQYIMLLDRTVSLGLKISSLYCQEFVSDLLPRK